MGGDVLRHTANLDLLVSGVCGLFRLGLHCSRWPLSRVEGSSTRARNAAGGIRGPRLPSGEFAKGESGR